MVNYRGRSVVGFTGFLLGFTGYYWVVWVLPGFTGFYWVLLCLTGFYKVLLGFANN